MNEKANSATPPPEKKGMVGLIILLIVAIVVIAIFLRPKSSAPVAAEATSPAENGGSRPSLPTASNSHPQHEVNPHVLQAAPVSIADIDTQTLANEIMEIGLRTPITSEDADKYKRNLAELIRRGKASLPAIEAMMKKNQDASFTTTEGGDALGFATMRGSLIDAISQIGGPEGAASLSHLLETAALPSEILQISQDLEKNDPGKHRDEILRAAHEVEQMAQSNQLGTNVDRMGIYRTIQAYSGADTPDQIAKNYPDQYNKAVELAKIGNAEGLPELLKMRDDGGGASQNLATEAIAQMSSSSPEAADALLKLAGDNKISNALWVQSAPYIAGATLGPDGQPVFPSNPSPDDINRYKENINRFLARVEPGSSAANALNAELTKLTGQ